MRLIERATSEAIQSLSGAALDCFVALLLAMSDLNQSGTTAVVSISSRASGSTRRVTATSAIAG